MGRSKNRVGQGDTNKYIIYLKGILLGVIVTAICVFVFAALMLLLKTGNRFAAPFATVSAAVGTFFAAAYTAKRMGRRGYINGLIIGIITFVIITVVSLIVDKGGLTMNTLFHFVIIILSSLIGGVVGVNFGRNKKFI